MFVVCSCVSVVSVSVSVGVVWCVLPSSLWCCLPVACLVDCRRCVVLLDLDIRT